MPHFARVLVSQRQVIYCVSISLLFWAMYSIIHQSHRPRALEGSCLDSDRCLHLRREMTDMIITIQFSRKQDWTAASDFLL